MHIRWIYARINLCLYLPPGGIELTVFSAHFKVELDVVDIQSQRVDRFGKRSIRFLRTLKTWEWPGDEASN